MNTQFISRKGVLFIFSATDTIFSKNLNKSSEGIIMNITLNDPDKKMERNINKLERISQLKENWNGYGAKPFPLALIYAAKNLIRKLYFQPQIFPTAAESIQFEFEKDNGDYLEFQFYGNGTCEVFRILGDHEEEFTSQDNFTSLNSIINTFYGCSFSV
jgi:hypothetical protein